MMTEIKKWTSKNLQGDPVIWMIVAILSIISVLVVYSAAGSLAYRNMEVVEVYLVKHGALIILSLVAMWVSHKIDYRYYSKISKLALWVAVPLLLFAWQSGTTINEASRWITIPVIKQVFQPSDLAKLALIAGLASMLAKRQQYIEDFKNYILPILLWIGAICGLIAMTDLSTAVLLFVTCMIVMFIGRVPIKYLALLVLVGALVGTMAISIGQRGQTAKSRIESFMNESDMPFQAEQAHIAIATGGITGKGPGNSDQKNFLPHPYSDFVFAIIIEEYGMIGGIFVLSLYLILLYRGMRAAAQSERAFGGLLSAGLSFAVVLQAMVNMGVVVGLGPITGLPLPLLSMGGTSLLFTGISLGIIQSVARGETDSTFDQATGEIRNIARAA
jgi:cell division protein FtsW